MLLNMLLFVEDEKFSSLSEYRFAESKVDDLKFLEVSYTMLFTASAGTQLYVVFCQK